MTWIKDKHYKIQRSSHNSKKNPPFLGSLSDLKEAVRHVGIGEAEGGYSEAKMTGQSDHEAGLPTARRPVQQDAASMWNACKIQPTGIQFFLPFF